MAMNIPRILEMTNDETWYFSYGSNLSKQQMLCRTGSIPTSVTAYLSNHRIAFRQVLNGLDVYATIIPTEGATVHGAAYLCSAHAMTQLDRLEGVAENCYRRELVRVATSSGEDLDCIVYVGESFHDTDELPSDSYLNLILTGAESHRLPSDYIDSIASLARNSQIPRNALGRVAD